MSLTPSTMQELGSIAPDFTLNAPDGKEFRLSGVEIKNGLLVCFICNHCPYVIHIREKLVEMIKKYQEKGVVVVAINSNDYSVYPDDSPKRMSRDIEQFNYTFPYLVDQSQEVAKAYKAACTPDFFLYNPNRELVYRGQFDSARPGNSEPITGDDLTTAVELVIVGGVVPGTQRPSMGCNIKWKSGNEPGYFGSK